MRPSPGGKPVRLGDPPPLLAGREELLTKLEARLSEGDEPWPRTIVLSGMGGVGKTSIALAHAQRHTGALGVAWQFPADDATVLAAGFGELAAQLGVRDVADMRDSVSSVHSALAALGVPWLLIFDNAPDQASVAAYIPPAGRGRIIITSQNPIWPPSRFIEVPNLSSEVAAGFLMERTGDADSTAAIELGQELGGLPLALEQAAAYIQATGDNLAGYLRTFRNRRTEMLARGEPIGYRGTVATTWMLAFSRLEESNSQAVGLLRLLAFCAPELVPLWLLLRQPTEVTPGPSEEVVSKLSRVLVVELGQEEAVSEPSQEVVVEPGQEVSATLERLLGDELVVRDAVAALRRYSLVSLHANGSVSVHRLVQAVTAAQMPAELAAEWHYIASVLIEAAIPRDYDQPDNWPVFAALLPHAQAALATESGSMPLMAGYLLDSGSYSAARDLYRRILEVHQPRLGPDHRNILALRTNLAVSTGRAGDPAEARAQHAALLPVMERVLGAEHPATLTIRGHLAHWAGDAGDAAGARRQYADLLAIRARVLGPEHLHTLISRANLARWTGEVGHVIEARDQFAALLPSVERVLGQYDPEVLHERNNLAVLTGRAGDSAAARRQLAVLLPIREKILGREHPDTLITRANLADWTGEAGDAAGARDQYAELVAIRARVLGPEHPSTLSVRDLLAEWTGEAGDAAGARDQYAELVAIRARVLGPEHPDTASTRVELALATLAAGDGDIADLRDQFAALLRVTEQADRSQSDILRLRCVVAELTGVAGDAGGACDLYSALVPAMKKAFGREHPETLVARAKLARWTGQSGNLAGARDQYTDLLPVMRRVLGADHPGTAAAIEDLARWTTMTRRRESRTRAGRRP